MTNPTTSPCIWISNAATSLPSLRRLGHHRRRYLYAPVALFHRKLIGSVAEYAPSGKYTVYMNTQTSRRALSRSPRWAYRKPESIIQSAVGGGLGGKSCDDDNALVCAVLARKAGKPVRVINTREEEFLAGCRPRVFMKINVKLGLEKDRPHSRQHQLKVVADNGAYSAKSARDNRRRGDTP